MPYTMPSGIGWGVDVYRAAFYPITSTGAVSLPTQAAELPYEGYEFSRPKSLALNLGAPRPITNVAQGRVQDTIYLPSTDAKTAEFHLSNIDMDTFAALGAVKSREDIGGMKIMPFGTDKQGLEIAGIFLISQLAFHDEGGVTNWHNYILPRVRAVVNLPNFDENAIDVTVNMSLSPTTKHVWGEALTEAVDGALEYTGIDHITIGRFQMVAWLTDGTEDVFKFPTNKQALANFADTMTLWDYNAGTEVTAGITKSAANITYASAPTTGKTLICLYEY